MRPWRSGDAHERPAVAVPPERLPMFLGGRPLKQWRYVGAYGRDVMVGAASARVGPLTLSWWAVWDRRTRTLAEGSHLGGRGVRLRPGSLRVDEGPVRIDLSFSEAAGVETISPHGGAYIWTRKQAIAVRGSVTVAEDRHEVSCGGIVDDSAGYHARHTDWVWSAGVGVTESGRPVAWNLVSGVHDDPASSERTVWVDGAPHHVAALPFRGLSGVGDLAFRPEATRARRENLLLLRSDYEQPFGTFSGSLPHAGPLREGFGVMERHSATW